MNLNDRNNEYEECIEVIQVTKDKNSLESGQGLSKLEMSKHSNSSSKFSSRIMDAYFTPKLLLGT